MAKRQRNAFCCCVVSLFAAIIATCIILFLLINIEEDTLGNLCLPEREKTIHQSSRFGPLYWLWNFFSRLSSESVLEREGPGNYPTTFDIIKQKVCACITSLGLLDALASVSRQVKVFVEKMAQVVQLVIDKLTVFVTYPNLQSQYNVMSHSLLPAGVILLFAVALFAAIWFVFTKKRKKTNSNQKKGQILHLADLSTDMDESQMSEADTSLNESVLWSFADTPKPLIHSFSYKISSNSGMLKNHTRWTLRLIFTLLVGAICVSIPWEFLRLYQKTVATRMATVLKGAPEECDPQTMGLLSNLRFFLRAQFSWGHDLDPCYQYHHALLVDPVW
ncbi:hypothetical protein EGW08_023059, partial [Elysia chlorotica]